MKKIIAGLFVASSLIANSSAITIEARKAPVSFNVVAIASDYVVPTNDSGDLSLTSFHIRVNSPDQFNELITIPILDFTNPGWSWTITPMDPTVLDTQGVVEDHIQFFLIEDIPPLSLDDQDGDIPLIVPSVPDGGTTVFLFGSAFLCVFLLRRKFAC